LCSLCELITYATNEQSKNLFKPIPCQGPAPIRQRLYPNCQSFSRQHHCYPQFTAHLQREEETTWRILDSAWLLYPRRWQPSRDSRRSRRLSEPKPALDGIDETHKRARLGGCAPLSGLKIEGFSTAWHANWRLMQGRLYLKDLFVYTKRCPTICGVLPQIRHWSGAYHDLM
jgi:hypothetical protein